MPNPGNKHQINLSTDQRAELEAITRQSSVGVAKKRWATILLLADAAHPDGRHTDLDIAEEVGVSVRQLERIRKKFVADGFGATLARKPRHDTGVPKVIDGVAEARLVAICCSTPPAGRDHWTLQLLCDELARLRVVVSVCPETVRQCLKKTSCSPGQASGSASRRKIGPDSSPRWKSSSTPTKRSATPAIR
jgi:hypothetical protein